MIEREQVIAELQYMKRDVLEDSDKDITLNKAIAMLKTQEAREPHYTTLRYLVNGMKVTVRHPECPRCIENGLALWDAEIEKGQA